VDSAANQILVGYGSGGLVAIDAGTFQRITDIPLPVHPEGFQLDSVSGQVFVNLPKSHTIAVVDRRSGKLASTWSITIAGDNFPMALRRDAEQILTVFRNPAKLGVFSIKDGAAAKGRFGRGSDLAQQDAGGEHVNPCLSSLPLRARRCRIIRALLQTAWLHTDFPELFRHLQNRGHAKASIGSGRRGKPSENRRL
jgi:hypothetical protein